MILRTLFAFALLNILAPSAQAQQSNAACVQSYNSCQTSCSREYSNDPASGSGCVARCTADRAACDAAAGYNAAKPWVQNQVDQMWRFIEGFMGPDATPRQPPQRSYPPNHKNKDWNNKDWNREENDGGDRKDNKGEDT